MPFKRKAATSVLLVAVLAAVAGMAVTFSAFVSTTESTGNEFKAGTVKLSDNDAGATLLSLAEMAPGSSQTRCLTVEYSGSLESTVRLYAETTSSAADRRLAPFLNIKVTRGAGPADLDCTGFVADATDYEGRGAGVIFDGTLDAYPAGWSTGLTDPVRWNTGDRAVYQVEVDLADDNDAQGKDATTQLSFEARDAQSTPAP